MARCQSWKEVLKIGKELQAAWLEKDENINAMLRTIVDEFKRSVMLFVLGQPLRLSRYLHSNRRLTRKQRHLLADVLEGMHHRSQNKKSSGNKRGRPKNDEAEISVTLARLFYQTWRKCNKDRDVNDHGCGDDMRGETARFIARELRP